MEIAESIYECFVESSYKKLTRADANRSGHSRKMRGESASSNNYSKISDSNRKHRGKNVDNTKNRPKLTCLIYGPGHSSDECKALGDFGSKYDKIIPTKDRGHDYATINKFNRQKYNNAIVKQAVDEILPKENNKASAEE